jgi:tRNA A22 N-methylase
MKRCISKLIRNEKRTICFEKVDINQGQKVARSECVATWLILHHKRVSTGAILKDSKIYYTLFVIQRLKGSPRQSAEAQVVASYVLHSTPLAGDPAVCHYEGGCDGQILEVLVHS